MSYNPAFVADESPLAHAAAGSDCQTSGIKLTSFKPLNVSLESAAASSENQSPAGQERQRGPARGSRSPDKGAKQSKTNKASKHSKSSASSNLLMSTSSSLSLIDNPALSSLATATTTATTTTNSATNNSSSSEVSSYSPSTTSSNASSLAQQHLGLCAAVECRDMRYAVGRGKNEKAILHDINVTVPEGSIYGLLGPSGCGKTTMLRCVVGRIKPRSGYVRVFGYKPNDSGSQIPGPAIGYMPQVSLVEPHCRPAAGGRCPAQSS